MIAIAFDCRPKSEQFLTVLVIAHILNVLVVLTIVAVLSEMRLDRERLQDSREARHKVHLALRDILVEKIAVGGWRNGTDHRDALLSHSRAIVVSTTITPNIANEVVRKLTALNSRDPNQAIDLYLTTYGGLQDSATAIIDTMHILRAPVNVWALGYCDSAGAEILVSGTGKRFATPRSSIMIHINTDDVKHRDPHSAYGINSLIEQGLWRSRARLPEGWYPFSGEHRYFLTPQQALRFHIIDEIRPSPANVAPR